MKKLITLLLVLTGAVCSASATDYIISGNKAIVNGNHTDDAWWWQDSDNILTETTTSGIYTLVVENCSLTAGSSYGFKVKVNENAWNNDTTFPSSDYNINVPYTGTYTVIYYVDIANQKIQVIATPMLRWNFGGDGSGNWDWLIDSSSYFTKSGDFTWTFEVSAEKFASDFSFRIYSGIFQKSAYPDGQDVSLTFGGSSSTSAWFNTAESTAYSWKLSKPSYDFDKIKITAVFNPFGNSDAGSWDVSADAYISKEITSKGIATFGSAAPVDFSKAIPATEGKGFTAKKGKVQSDGAIKWTAATTLAANEGAFLEGDADTYSIPVAASASADTENNDFVAITEEQQIAQTVDGKNAYILSEKNGVVGFYKPASDGGSWCAAGTAYLATNVSPAHAREFFPLWDEDVTAVEAVKQEQKVNGEFFNLAGQRVAQPTKGLYIVNGKKVVLK